ncbi:MAG: Mpo1-like protein [Rubrivivax sp.]
MATPFRPATTLLTQYAEYHRDRRNIATHLVGVPLIVFGIGVLLSRPAFEFAGLALTPAWVVFVLVAAWYLTRGALSLGLAVSAGVAALMALAHRVDPAGWLAWGVGSFVVGWIIQFIGHYYEGRKPAFVDDLIGLLVAPMFVVLEVLAALGLFKPLMADIERRAGPTHLRDLAHPATR